MNSLVYARYSTHKQDAGVSIENQISRCKEYAKFKSFGIVDIIQDLAISGGVNRTRPGFMELLARVERAECDLILTYDLTRLSREMLSLLALERFLNEYDCLLYTVEGQVDTSSVEGFMSFAMRALYGEIERRVVKHRTKSAMQHLKRNGKVYNHAPYGWKREGDHLVEVPQEQSVIQLVNGSYSQGLRLADIQRMLDKKGIKTRVGANWQPQQVKNLIDNYRDTKKQRTTEIGIATKAFIQAIA